MDVIDKRLIFVFYVLISYLVFYIINNFIITEQYYYNFLGQQLTIERIKQFLSFRDKWQWVGYLFIPLMLLLKVCFVSFAIYLGTFFTENNVSFKRLFGIVLLAEGVFIFAGIVKMFILLVSNFNTFEKIQTYYPLSFLNHFDTEKLKPWEIYIYNQFNFFHAIYIIFLSYCYSRLVHIKFFNSILFILNTYGLAIVLWITLVIYFGVIM